MIYTLTHKAKETLHYHENSRLTKNSLLKVYLSASQIQYLRQRLKDRTQPERKCITSHATTVGNTTLVKQKKQHQLSANTRLKAARVLACVLPADASFSLCYLIDDTDCGFDKGFYRIRVKK